MPPKPCRSGHVSKRYSNSGICWECARLKAAGETMSALTQEETQRSIPTVVYVIRAGEFVKVGIAEDVSTRLQVLRTHCPIPASLVYATMPIPRRDARKIEALCAIALAGRATQGEWYRCDAEDAIAVIRESYDDVDRAVDPHPDAVQLSLVV
jgi:hypothetical protein